MKRGVIFDFYGTLIEGDARNPSPWEYLTSKGFASSKEIQKKWESDAFDGQLTPSIKSNPSYQDWLFRNYAELTKLSGVPNDLVDIIAKEVLLNDKNWTFKAKPHAKEVISLAYEKGLVIGICSNWDYPLEGCLAQTGLGSIKHFSVSCEVGARKPHPIIFHDILMKTKLKPSEAIYIGDTWNADIIGATNIGLEAIYLNEQPHEEILNSKNVQHMKSLQEVYNYINQL